MPQGCNTLPGWFLNVFNEAIKGLERVVGYLDDAIVFNMDAASHLLNIQALLERLRRVRPEALSFKSDYRDVGCRYSRARIFSRRGAAERQESGRAY